MVRRAPQCRPRSPHRPGGWRELAVLSAAVVLISLPALRADVVSSRALAHTDVRSQSLRFSSQSLIPRRALSLRGGGVDYDSKDAQKYDRVLWDMMTQHPDEIYFLNTVFNFLQRRTPCFNGPKAERNYQILIDTLTKQKEAYLEHVRMGKPTKAPEPMPEKTNAAPHTAPRAGMSADADSRIDTALEAVGAATGKNIDGYKEGWDETAVEVDVKGHGKLKTFEGSGREGDGVGGTGVEGRSGGGGGGEGTCNAMCPAEAHAHSAGGKTGGKGQEVLQTPVNNGGRTDQYVWSQTLHEVTLEVFLPKNTPTKSIRVDMTVTRLTVTLADGAESRILLQGEFEEETKPDEGIWHKEDDLLVITVTKRAQQLGWWASALKGHAKVDLQKVEPEQSQLHDLDPEMRQTVEKMMHDQKMKAQGKPTLDEEKKRAQMEKFMAMHPEMDFSKCKFG